MAVPKKKTSRSRRGMRRFSSAYKIDPVAFTTGTDGNLVRTHTVTLETLAAYIEAKKSGKKSASKKASAKA